jgi:hypothetical protein
MGPFFYFLINLKVWCTLVVLAQGFTLFLEMLKFSKKSFSQRNLLFIYLFIYIYI